jgi:Holliday junction resolvase RusA-like endonuclease
MDNFTRMNIKPLSCNKAWRGVRYKTDDYKAYEKELLYTLPNIKLPEPPYQIEYIYGYSSESSDWDNAIKQTTDILAKKYQFNDKLIKRGIIEKVIVPKGQEHFEFKITHYKKP